MHPASLPAGFSRQRLSHLSLLLTLRRSLCRSVRAIPAVSDVELSPDGKPLAWSEPAAKGQLVVIYDLDAHVKKRSAAPDPESTLRSLRWADNETLLITAGAFTTFGERK